MVIDKYISSEELYIHLSVFEKNISSPVLIFIPGSGCYSLLYFNFLSALHENDFNVIGLDLPGHGKSGGKRGKFTYREVMKSISLAVDYATETYNDKIGIIGSSLGGFLSLYACGEEKRIKSAVCHNVIDLQNLPSTRKIFSYYPVQVTLKIISYIFPNIYIPLSFLFSWRDVFEDERHLYELKNDKLMVWKYALSSITSLFLFNKNKPLVEELSTKIFVLVSENDKILTEDYCKNVFDKITSKDKKFLSIPGAGHMLFIEYIPQVIEPVSQWFHATL